MERSIVKRSVERAVVELGEQVQQEWNAISQEAIRTLIDSMPDRTAEVIAAY